MPSRSQAQAKMMRAVAHSPKFAAKVGIPVKVGKEFAGADAGRKLSDLPRKVKRG